MEWLSKIDPALVIQGGAVLVAFFALSNNRKLSDKIGTILQNHLKHMGSNQEDDIKSRENLAATLEGLKVLIQEHVKRVRQKH